MDPKTKTTTTAEPKASTPSQRAVSPMPVPVAHATRTPI